MTSHRGEFWVFGYGSLMWRPGFPYEAAIPARLYGYHRALCVASVHYRGTREHPGLVLGLDRGGSCVGIAFRVAEEHREPTLDYLHEREMLAPRGATVVHAIYREITAPVLLLASNERVEALAYAVDRRHPDYAGKLAAADIVARVRAGHGVAGPNVDYVKNTLAHLAALGVRDPALEAIARHL